ncbi:hypothetical protein NVP1238A_91 [Vibrio phage 1.238.A._10N.261.52.F10]|nr:hypothetical protein KNT79_gp91 [Vibrio phage 1.238.A._10N.261.52.F10]AUR97340.1 hypothetical protein NVP1238A_91 [Vibrio phage 1.238.A._10N.261.52.F10]AUR97434.1 hypothetical protein NVP1238B_92 [Vibrio phage 1.238.B._10N.261.52.F10]
MHILTESIYDAMYEELSILASESGADREYDFDSEEAFHNHLDTRLGEWDFTDEE